MTIIFQKPELSNINVTAVLDVIAIYFIKKKSYLKFIMLSFPMTWMPYGILLLLRGLHQ